MGRSTTIVKTGLDTTDLNKRISAILIGANFKATEQNGSQLWKKGNGWLVAPQAFQITMAGDTVTIESWIQIAILPFVYVGESSLESIYGFALKAFQRKTLRLIVEAIILPGSAPEGYYPS